MSDTVAITVLGAPDDVERRFRSEQRDGSIPSEATVRFQAAPGDRGTEIHVELPQPGKLAGAAQKVTGSDPRAKALDELRRFKQLVETGVIARSDAVPEGELAERKLKQRPGQPLDDSELEQAGVR
jgi:hypothetical protein